MPAMKLCRFIVPLLVVGGVAAWFFRDLARDKYEELRWSESMRKEDPVGYIDFAIGRLDENKERFTAARSQLAAAQREAQNRQQAFETKLAFANELASKMKTAFTEAESGTGYPISFAVGSTSKDYSRSEFIQQVALTLAERDALSEGIEELSQAIQGIEETRSKLAERMVTIDANRVKLQTQRAVAAVQSLSSEVEELLSNVDALIQEDTEELETLPDDPDPVRSLDEFLRDLKTEAAATAPSPPTATEEALHFLED